MARLIKSSEKSATTNARGVIQKVLGELLANREGQEIHRLREGILVSTDEGDLVIKVILKKEEIEYTEEDILDTFMPDKVE